MSQPPSDLMQRMECFKDLVETASGFDESHARLMLQDLRSIIAKSDISTKNVEFVPELTLLIYREILELATLMSVRIHDSDLTTDLFQSLNFYYFHCRRILPSNRMFTIIDLNLLIELSMGKKEEFISDFSSVQTVYPGQSARLRFASDINQCLAEDSFQRLCALQVSSPSSLFSESIEKIVDLGRKSLASDLINGCKKISASDLRKMLKLDTEERVLQCVDTLDAIVSEDNKTVASKPIHPNDPETHETQLEEALSAVSRFVSLE